MHAYFILLPRVFVDETRTVHRILVNLGGEGCWTRNFRAVSHRHVDNLLCRIVYDFRIIGLHLDPKALDYFFFSMFCCQRACETSKRECPSLPPDPRAPCLYFRIFVTTPAPTVFPPSRIAKRCFSSSATGAISFTVNLIVSPGITISVPWGSVTSPVTSVVRI